MFQTKFSHFYFVYAKNPMQTKILKIVFKTLLIPVFFTHLVNNIFMTIFIQELITWWIFCIYIYLFNLILKSFSLEYE